jgi:hypothetical protein
MWVSECLVIIFKASINKLYIYFSIYPRQAINLKPMYAPTEGIDLFCRPSKEYSCDDPVPIAISMLLCRYVLFGMRDKFLIRLLSCTK